MAKKTKTNLKQSKTQTKLLLLFAIIFAGIGVYLLRNSFAWNFGGSVNVYSYPATLKAGDRDSSVLTLKEYLRLTTGYFGPGTTGYNPKLFDDSLTEAVKGFQNKFGLTVDGIVGPNTWTGLFKVHDAQMGQNILKLSGSGPKVISVKAAYNGTLIKIYCPVDQSGKKFDNILIQERGYERYQYAYFASSTYNEYRKLNPTYRAYKCGTDGTAFVGMSYTNNLDWLSGQHTYEIYGSDGTMPRDKTMTGMESHRLFVTYKL